LIWKIKEKVPEEFIKQFPEYSPIVLQLLFDRGLKNQKQIDEFFNPDYEDLHDPLLMLGVKKAVDRIAKAIKRKAKIAIFGDYDADGVCGAVILKTVLDALGANLDHIYIPNRLIEGYGLNDEAIKKVAAAGVKLIITVDCGITDFDEIALANSLGLEVIVTDHHLVGKKLPPAKVIIDPFQPGDNYPFKELAGAGVAFKLAQALLKSFKFRASGFKLQDGWEKWLLDLVALATVADCMPLLGENRTLVRYGLIVLAQTQRMGLQELMKIARLDPIFEVATLKTNLDSYSLGFILAPRINAAGRIEHANLALDLLVADNREKAKAIALKINDFNRQRQKMTDEIIAQIEEQIKNDGLLKDNPVIVQSDKNWSPGIIGLVAGRVADKYHRPTFIFSEQGELWRGSARSISAFNIIEAIKDCADLLEEFGGHAGSAGVRIKKDKFPQFYVKINQSGRTKLKAEDLVPAIEIDAEIEAEDINWRLFDELVKFEPFGKGNERPVFSIKNLEIISSRTVGNGSQHLKLELKSDKLENKVFKAIGFRLAKNGNGDLKPGDKVDLAFEIIVDEWNGNRDLQLKIIDIRPTV